MQVDESDITTYWRKKWTELSFPHLEEDAKELSHNDPCRVGDEEPDPVMSEEDREWAIMIDEEDDKERVALMPASMKAQEVGIEYEEDWPYGADNDNEMRDRIVSWARSHKLRLTQDRVCLDWLRVGSCPHSWHRKRDWMDHITGWTRDDEPTVLLSQPYGLQGRAIAQLADIHARGFGVEIDGTGWYGYGTTFVSIWRETPAQSRGQ